MAFYYFDVDDNGVVYHVALFLAFGLGVRNPSSQGKSIENAQAKRASVRMRYRGRHEAGRGFDLERMRSEPFSPDLQDLIQHVSNALPNC
ncbi:hypothetical protein [Mesorhizobium silamurunense]|uniref:hypothetical protein n=1 Tax=Mesorhizobium silamurunense TaxID=499528 RepID=UPI0017845E69|nr:hypothetical protein [Mesorhizobium silamurunense]